MCGVYGSVGFNRESLDCLEKIKTSMNHRGPDSFNYKTLDDSNLFFAHSRLAIIDMSSNALQPMCDSLTGNILVFNGEIYNYQELKIELIKLGHIFKSKSDTEVILVGYRHWGIDVLSKLVGMFAIGFWDNKEKKLIIARDRMGEKPLYYYTNSNGKFIFSSEINSIILHDCIGKEINESSLFHYIKFGFMPNNESIFKNIKKLEPAHHIEIKSGNIVRIKKYWFLENFFINKNHNIKYDEALEEVGTLLSKSVGSQMLADVDLGVYLSGGVDSGLIAASMKEQSQSVSSFCAGFIENSYDEGKRASLIAEILKINHGSIVINPLTFEEILEPYRHADEPFSDTSSIPMFYLAKNSKEFCTVFLSGDGGDELFGGYETYRADILHHKLSLLPKGIISGICKAVNGIPTSFSKVSFDYKIKKFFSGASKKYEIAHESWRQVHSHKESIELMLQMGYSNNSLWDEERECKFWAELPNAHFLDRSMYVDMKTWLPNDILYKVDRMTMAHSIESRAPFLDHRLIEFTSSLPVSYKIKMLEMKCLLKDLAIKKFNLDYRKTKKNGFSPPISHWIIDYSNEVNEFISNSRIFDKNYVAKLINDHVLKKANNGFKINNMMSLVAWKNNLNI